MRVKIAFLNVINSKADAAGAVMKVIVAEKVCKETNVMEHMEETTCMYVYWNQKVILRLCFD